MKNRLQEFKTSLKNIVKDEKLVKEIELTVENWLEQYHRFEENPHKFMQHEDKFVLKVLGESKDIRKKLSRILNQGEFTIVSDGMVEFASYIMYELSRVIGSIALEEIINKASRANTTQHTEKPIGICTVIEDGDKSTLKREIYNLTTYRKISEGNGCVILVTPNGQVERIEGVTFDDILDEYYPSPKVPVVFSEQANSFVETEAKKPVESEEGTEENAD